MADSKSDPKDGESFFRKVVRFVANPATDWAELNSQQDPEARNLEFEKSELKAMIERKRRNDFVRKREFDVLRKVRREGLSSEQLAALAGSSRIDDSEVRMETNARADAQVKAKIDEIEQQMVGDNFGQRRNSGYFGASTDPAPLADTPAASFTGRARAPAPADADTEQLPALPPLPDIDLQAPAQAPVVASAGLPPLSSSGAPARTPSAPAAPALPPLPAIEVSEVVHDPELDEAVIAFANADFDQCEASLQGLTADGGPRHEHPETWLVLFDLYRATGQQHKFESLAVEYAQQFGWSSPQWFSMPRLVAEAAQEEKLHAAAPARVKGEVGWVCPEVLDTDAVAQLRSQTLQLPLPWVFDWGHLRHVDPEAASQLSQLFRQWAKERLEMRWLDGDNFFQVLQEAAPTGVRDADPIFWTVRLDALSLANRPDQFDELAIDYCVTYEVSPPQWEPTKCNVRISGGGQSTHSPAMSVVSEVSTSFLESTLTEDDAGVVRSANVELSGQLVGDIGPTLAKLDSELGTAPVVNVSCARLIRVDFIAAGDLLNWVLTKRSENRAVGFAEAHRLVALFFGAMGINEHARVRVRVV
ncbi:STAS domain-containing protein [Ideonella sp. BN130291]|uniref:STAS domain-containing protein n=1 Tax=Ideonella sp. BN130291 TaxID=3112940 RepID=UPI002E265C1A|nr:STAS domain-containing protein [Ideonella sp. BN130291]